MKIERKIAIILAFLLITPVSYLSIYNVETANPPNTETNLLQNLVKDVIQSDFEEDPIESFARLSDIEPPQLSEENGLINPISIEQRGFSTTENISARTDTHENTNQFMEIDTEHNWIASSADVHVWDLKQLYVLNGTFDQGISGINIQPNGTVESYPFGWSSTSNDTGTYSDDIQTSVYDDADRTYTAVENQGGKVGQNAFGHDAGISIFWTQIVENVPYTENFLLNFDYFYLRGPLDLNPSYPISGNCSIKVYIDGVSVWNMSLLTLSERGVWSDIGVIPISLPEISSSFTFSIGLEIDESMTLDKRYDYDNNGLEDGPLHTQYISVYFDDISLIATSPPDCEVVGLEFILDGMTSGIIGDDGTGFGIVTNTGYWTSSSISFSIYSNTSLSFNYHIHLLSHRFLNSSSTTDISNPGVQYYVNAGSSIELDFYTYLGIIGDYDNFSLRIYPHNDWDNFTIYDSFLTDVTSSCFFDVEYIEIPTAIIDVLGWWEINCQSPNYASSAVTQRYDFDSSSWVEDDIYHTGDIIRLSANIGSFTHIPLLTDAVNFTWNLPNCTPWYESSVISGLQGSVVSSHPTFGATNATAGQWCISYLWTNGTEVAYGFSEFALHHQASIEIVFEDDLETVVGQPVTVVVRFYDIENGLLILNNGASITSTWEGGIVDFEVNLVKNWWEADFDTALVGAGNFNVTITSSAPFFETSPVVVTIESLHLTDLATPAGPLEPLIYGRSYSFDFFYSRSYDDLGITGATVEIIDEGSQWASITDNGNGHYNLTLVPMGLRDYNIRITFSKVGYENQTFVLSFLVQKVPIEVRLLTSLSKMEFESVYLEVEIVEVDTEIPVPGANVTLGIRTSDGDYYTIQILDEMTGGHYNTTFTMPAASSITYSLNIQVEKNNYELDQVFRDTLVPQVDTDARLFQTFIQYSQQIALGASVLIAAVVTQRVYTKRSRRKRAAAREIEKRFDDAENLLGLLILHKVSGVPIFSKILKGGFEEGMLSAFISAIMHFRSEFETVEMDDEYKILPISDIIRAVPTPNLICAFITITSPSPEQEKKMVEYARAIGMMLDETLKSRPTQVVDAKTAKTFEWLFDDFVDGALLRRYQVNEDEFSRKYKPLKAAIEKIASDGIFVLKELVHALENGGLSEYNAYILVMDAVDNEVLVPVYSFNDISISDDESG